MDRPFVEVFSGGVFSLCGAQPNFQRTRTLCWTPARPPEALGRRWRTRKTVDRPLTWQEQGSYQVTAALSGEHRPQADRSPQRHNSQVGVESDPPRPRGTYKYEWLEWTWTDCKHVLGVWLGDGGEGAKYWLSVLTEIRNRGLEDALIVCCDGLRGHSRRDRGHMAPGAGADLCDPPAASLYAPMQLERPKNHCGLATCLHRGKRRSGCCGVGRARGTMGKSLSSGVIRIWRQAWEEFTPFLRFPPELRRIVYTTNVVESVHYQLRKVTKTRGHFPTDQSALKLLRLAARNITNKRGGNLGTGTRGWKTALNQLEIHFPNRLNLTR